LGRKTGSQQGREESKEGGKISEEEEVTEGTDSGLHHPATVDGENSYSLRRSGASKVAICGPKNGNAHAIVHEATNH